MLHLSENRIRKLRKEKGLTLKELSQQLKDRGTPLSASSLIKYERGERNPRLETWVKLADFFNVSIPYLQGDSDVADWDMKIKKSSRSLENARNSGDRKALEEAILDVRKTILGTVSDNSDELKLYFHIFNLLLKQEPLSDDLKKINESLTTEHYQAFISAVIELLKIYLYSVGKKDKNAQSALKKINEAMIEYEENDLV